MSTNNLIVFASETEYAPAQQLIHLLESSVHFQVRGLKRSNAGLAFTTSTKVESSNLNGTSFPAVKDIFQDFEVAVMFIMPADLSEVEQLTRTFLEAASEAGVQRLAWVAPACPEVSELGKRLAQAEKLVRSSKLETLVLRHAPLFSDLLDQKKELKSRRTLSLPLGNSALPWLAPDVISEALYKWVLGDLNHEPPDVLTGPSQLTGDDIAKELSEALRKNANSRRFAQNRLRTRGLMNTPTTNWFTGVGWHGATVTGVWDGIFGATCKCGICGIWKPRRNFSKR